MEKYQLNNNGVSEVIGFIFIFGLIISVVTLTFITGVPSLQFVGSQNSFENIKQHMQLIERDQAALINQNTKISKSQIIVNDNTNFKLRSGSRSISVNGKTIAQTTFQYESSNKVEYEHSAVVQNSGSFSVMLSKPSWIIKEKEAIINIPKHKIGEDSSLQSRGSNLVSELENVETTYYRNKDVNISLITINTKAWESYFLNLESKYSNIKTSKDKNKITLKLENYNKVVVKKYLISSKLSK